MVGALFRKRTDYPFYSEIFFYPPSFKSSVSEKAKVQFYCTGATTDFCVDNQ